MSQKSTRTTVQLLLCVLLVLGVSFMPSHAIEQPGQGPDRQGGIILPIGGSASEGLLHEVMKVSGVKAPKVVIVPFAGGPNQFERSIPRAIKRFENGGASSVSVIDSTDIPKAIQLLESSDIIYMTGGQQWRLHRVLRDYDLLDVLHKQHANGTMIAGSSAGASIMSDIMMRRNLTDEDGNKHPILGRGAALWPETIVDQHFSERDRLSRLEAAIRMNPELIGVGIDENTGIVFDPVKGNVSVIGAGTVTLVKATQFTTYPVTLDVQVLRTGEETDWMK